QLTLYTPNITGVKQVSCGNYHTVFLMEDGTVRTVGYNAFGQCGTGNTTNPQLSLYTPNITGVKQVACGNTHTVFLMEDGTVRTVGLNTNGQCGTGNTTTPQLTFYNPNTSGVKHLFDYVLTETTEFQGNIDKTIVHNEDVILSGLTVNLNDGQVQYKILVNDIQIYPSNGYTPLAGSYDINYTIYNNQLNLGDNTITIAMSDENGKENSASFSAVVTNEIPVVSLSFDSSSVHNGNVILSGSISDPNGDYVSYRVLNNGSEIKPWESISNPTANINFTIQNDLLIMGSNNITVEFKDNFKGGQLGSWNGLIDVLDNNPTATVTVTPISSHYEDIVVNATLDDVDMDNISYKISLNGKQIFPVIGFTTPTIAPINITDYSIPNTLLNLGSNIIEIEYKDNFKSFPSIKWNQTINVVNNAPAFTSTSETTTISSKQNAVIVGSLTDIELDRVAYRVLANGEIITDWSDFFQQPYIVNTTIPFSRLNFGANSVVLEFKDNFKTNLPINSYSTTITKTNNKPLVNLSILSTTVTADISDPDSDNIQYKIELNGNPFFPLDGTLTPLATQPRVYNHTFTSNEVVTGSSNTITVTAQDEFGEQVIVSGTFEGVYTGIMFADINGNYYSTDLGEILFYLDFGTITAGQTTDSVPIRVINKNGYKITNISLSRDNNTLPVGASIELSKTDAPFSPSDALVYPVILDFNEEIIFYIRLATNINAEPASSNFIIYVKGDPIG
ncbi:MAG: hypothetical protein WCR54_07475, partial [Clostridia bacterium]